ncbi:MAG: preprotein translocase subunit YajC [Acidobacteria bacterium]|nr:MAG: preprotein translocase subunit YajC [Acidobacteriota bacterium]
MNTITSVGSLAFLQPSGGGSQFLGLLPFILIFVIFYFLLIRPQQRKQRQAQQERTDLLKSLKAGDKVVTTGGFYGTIVAVREKDDTVQLRIAQSVSVEAERSAIARLQESEKEVESTR